MPFEKGGRADKLGNRYEINCIISEILKVLKEKNYSVIIEAIGTDEIGTDILITTFDGQKEHQQCKARNGSKEYWDIYDLKSKNIFSAWKIQLDRDVNRHVSLISPMVCSFLVDLHNRACNTSGNEEDFHLVQINKSSNNFKNFYKKFCNEMDLVENNEDDVLKSIDYLKRIHYKQISEYQLQELIKENIQYLFSSKFETVYNALVSFVVMENVLGKEITQTELYDYFRKQKINFKLIDGDRRIVPRINEINYEYRTNFHPLQKTLIHRKEFNDCICALENEKGIIISGKAGYGKSGCTEAILDYCEKNKIPHIAIKLDQRIPHKNCETWGRELGFPGSIVHSIHHISKNENAVIILDQLDALRWTQANSSEAIAVCVELIRQVNYLNDSRKKKIIVVFVCRTYDLENDNNINSLFKNHKDKKNEWEIINVKCFQEDVVKRIVGENYNQLPLKLKKILKIPSNLYIWQHLDKKVDYNACLTTSHLIDKWFEQICKKSITSGLSQDSVNKTKKSIVDILDHTGRLFIPKSMLGVDEAGLDYLISSEILLVQNNKIGFVHQSILDYFISQEMIRKYLEGQSVNSIIGNKDKQTPGRRYQVQMFLQNLLEYDSGDFVSFGEQMLSSDDIRYYVKYVFYEILGQIQELDNNIIQFILENCENESYGNYLIDNTIFGRKNYIKVLRNHGILERWYFIPEKKKIVFNLLHSITPDWDEEDIVFIKQHAFNSEDDDKQFMKCFLYNIAQESDMMFQLRMMFYKYYPEYSKEIYVDVKNRTVEYEGRIIQLISFWLKNKIRFKDSLIFRFCKLDISNDFVYEENLKLISNVLIPNIPKESNLEVKYSDWSGRYHTKNIERTCVKIVEKANKILCHKYPECFWKQYKPYMGKGYLVFNELILKGFINLPPSYSNQIIRYLSRNMDNNIFDYTSQAHDELELVKNILKIHGKNCDDEEFEMIEKSIYFYVSPKAKEWYEQRINYNKSQKKEHVYWSFWGDLQYELLSCLPEKRLGEKTRELLRVLRRRFYNGSFRYYNDIGHFGKIISPIYGKKISKEQWYQIITNRKLKKRKSIEVEGGFVESSNEQFARDFQMEVVEFPLEMIDLVLKTKERVLPIFIDALFSGILMTDKLEKIDYKIIEKLFLEFPCDMNNSNRASCFCGIIKKMNQIDWAEFVINQLIDIALRHHDLEFDKSKAISFKDSSETKNCQILSNIALNCVRGIAATTIGNLILKNEKLFSKFKEVIAELVNDKNLVVRFASLYALFPSFNIEREWAGEKFLNLYESDICMVSFYESREVLFQLYSQYRERVMRIILKSFESEDEKLVNIGGRAICEFYICYDEFKTIIYSTEYKNEKQIKAILDMAVNYLGEDIYRDKAKNIILAYKHFEFPLEKMFCYRYIDLQRDKQFMLEFMKTRASRKIVKEFIHYLEENAISIVDYSEIILQLCENVLFMKKEELMEQWGIVDDISKLIMALYDETVNSTKTFYKQIANKCLDLWDIMFKRQIGAVREVSRKLMEH